MKVRILSSMALNVCVGTKIDIEDTIPEYTASPLARKSRKPVLANKYYVKSFNAQISTTY